MMVIMTIPPVITINGSFSHSRIRTAYSDTGATANDAFHGSTTVSSSGSGYKCRGGCTITYTATDYDGNTTQLST